MKAEVDVSHKVWSGVVVALLGASAIGLAAQLPGSKSGNPTPGTPQPDMPNLADRITLTGCIQAARQSTGERAATTADPNLPSNSRFVLTKAERVNVVPPGAGTSSLAAVAVGSTYRLRAIDSLVSAFVGTKVEISGEVEPATTPGAAGDESANAPTLRVEFVQKLAANCS